MTRPERIFIAGHRGLVGSAIARQLAPGFGDQLLLRTRDELDLRDQSAVNSFFKEFSPDQVYLVAGRVGGIKDNSEHPAEFILDNLLIASNVIDAAYRYGTRKLLYLGSSCIYPKLAPQPLKPEHLLSGPLEPTNRAYAVAKIAGIEMCRAYRSQYGFNAIAAMPTNLYGPGDNFDLERSHVLPALLRRFVAAADSDAAEVVVWGSGKPRREFLFVDDLAEAAVMLMQRYDDGEIINIGCGTDATIAEIASTVAEVTGFRGEIRFDTSMPDGTPQKLLDIAPIRELGWAPRTSLTEGLRKTLHWYREQRS
ncbi:MAG: GDP-L-fucose synthase [Betaproteobacteria bacterium]|jgi:GDP-L-fucose synthase|nr:GDP-L-fucose synthase [Betaproteobacteria bacterium]